MLTIQRLLLPALVFSLSCASPSSGTSPAPAASASVAIIDAPPEVVATINGVQITDLDVRYKLKNDMHSAAATPLHRKNAVEAIIRQELIRQRAVELGLESDPAYQQKVRQAEAQLAALKRSELTELFFRHEIAGKAEVSDDEAKKYFTENAARIQTEVHFNQILWTSESPAIEAARKELEGGAAFEEVAKKQYREAPPAGQTPWDIGFLKWNQIPEQWRSVVDGLKPGGVSGVIKGPKNRSWIIKVVAKRENKDLTFESVKLALKEVMKNAKVEELRTKSERDLREKAKIAYSKTGGQSPDVEP